MPEAFNFGGIPNKVRTYTDGSFYWLPKLSVRHTSKNIHFDDAEPVCREQPKLGPLLQRTCRLSCPVDGAGQLRRSIKLSRFPLDLILPFSWVTFTRWQLAGLADTRTLETILDDWRSAPEKTAHICPYFVSN